MKDASLEDTTFNMGDTAVDVIAIVHSKNTTAPHSSITMLQNECHLLEHQLEDDPQIRTQDGELDIGSSHIDTGLGNLC